MDAINDPAFFDLSLIQERAIHSLTLAIGDRLRLVSPVCFAEELEDCIMAESAKLIGLKDDTFIRLPPSYLSQRKDMMRRYHEILEGLIVQLDATQNEDMNTDEWWNKVNRIQHRNEGSAGLSGDFVTPSSFFEHYRPTKTGESWGSLAIKAGRMQKYLVSHSPDRTSAQNEYCFLFPSDLTPDSLNEYLRVFCGSGKTANSMADKILLDMFKLNNTNEGFALLSCKPDLEQATTESALARQCRNSFESMLPKPGGSKGRNFKRQKK